MIDVFKNLRNGNLNPREVFKNQNNLKSDLRNIRNRNPDLKLGEQISVIWNVNIFFDLKEKNYQFF